MSDVDPTQRIADLTAVLEITRQLGATTDLDRLLELIVSESLRILDAERGTVFLYDAKANELVSTIATGERELRVPADRGIVGSVAQSGEVLNVPDAYADARFNPEVDRKTGFRTHNVLTLPLKDHEDKLVGVLQILNKRAGRFGPEDEHIAGVFGAQAGVALQRARLIDEYVEKKRLEGDMAIARSIQQQFLPDSDPEIPGFDVAGWNRPADETGGDCYDFFPLPGGLLSFCLADATGHGIGAALMIAECRALLRGFVRDHQTDVGRVIDKTNWMLCVDLPPGKFVTAFLGVLDPAANRMVYTSAGQGPIFHFRVSDQRVRQIDANTFPLGILESLGLDEAPSIVLDPGDMVVLITDGFFEWANADDEQFGTRRISELIVRHQEQSSRQLIDTMREAVEEFVGDQVQDDDLTAVVVKRLA